MDSLVRNYLIASNLFTIVELVHHQMANFSAVNTTDASSDKGRLPLSDIMVMLT